MKKPKTSVVSFTAYDTETKKILLNVKRGLHSLRMMIKQCECKDTVFSNPQKKINIPSKYFGLSKIVRIFAPAS